MIAGLFRRANARRRAVEELHVALSMAARRPGLYTRLGVPDTVEGRFESLCLHTILVLRRLNRLPAPAAEVAQDLVNSVFTQLDASLRELGVGDMGVSKRMKKLGAAFYGRAEGYDAALNAGDTAALRAVLSRNVLGGEGDGAGLAAYVRAADAALAGADLDGLLGGGPPFPEPDGFAPASARAADATARDATGGMA
ncbi:MULTISPECIES: ubiquinol-cytochrome C chaperone family protein [Methylobacterium]|uniref:Ubiquinol-cytochrome C chaperone family protein n=1 Tax=Methylobacterium longum TaxID=767694 RepID=A0ABT8AQL1_9HYPH|nr:MULTISPECIES: ubiquinol-cytochrome C chaperone family protein [Methylobacterium]MCJ2102100.1 ubiquinol-cytochrome C chaperone [Methylobacterium sp. E-046]MDN3572025.1 ubiquinol-cytochrome C chaperone family protein [Methylobacterium longum]